MVLSRPSFRYIICYLGTIIVLMAMVINPGLARADLRSDLEARKRVLQETIKQQELQKEQQRTVAESLQAEIDKLGQDMAATQSTIDKVSADITKTVTTIGDLNGQIAVQEQLVKNEETKLESSLDHMYIETEVANPILVLTQSSISDTIETMEGYQAVEEAVVQKAETIETAKAALMGQRETVQQEQNRLQQLQAINVEQKRSLDAQLALKNELQLQTFRSIAEIDTKIADYENEISAVDGKISAFLAALQLQPNYVAASGDLVVVNAQPWHYFQTDIRWASQPLDPNSPSSDTFGESGCLVTAVTMVANRYGIAGTPPEVLARLRANDGMYGDLLAWYGVRAAFGGKLDFVGGTKELINWGAVDASLAYGKPVILHIRGGGSGHWVVTSAKVNGFYTIEDPYFGNGRIYPNVWVDYMARLQPI